MITSGKMVKDEQHFEHPEEFMPDRWDKSQSAALYAFSGLYLEGGQGGGQPPPPPPPPPLDLWKSGMPLLYLQAAFS